MTDLPILDAARIELITGGNAALAREFLDALFEEANAMIERLAVLVTGDDRVAVGDVAHTIKGNAMELGAMRLRAVAAAFEADTQPARWPDHLTRLRAALIELQEFAKP